jgi:hypothetical protein
MALKDFPAYPRPDNTNLVGGADGEPMRQSQGKQVTRTGTTSAEGDYDIQSHDLSNEVYETGRAEIGGADIISGAIESEQDNNFNIILEWMDQDGNILYTEKPASAQGVSDHIIESITVKGDNVNIKMEDSAADGTNEITGTLNIH